MTQNFIHPTAIIDKTVEIGEGNTIGPYCVITGNVVLGNNNNLKSHVIIHGNGLTTIADENVFFPFCSLHITQDKKYHGEESKLIIGSNNVFREYSSANSGTEAGGMITSIGDNCLFMMSSHIAHDCIIGNNVILSNSVAVAGHVTIGDFVQIGGLSGILQRTRIGSYAMIGGMSAVAADVIPYGMVVGERAYLAGLNITGLKRRGVSKDTMHVINDAYKMIFTDILDKNFAERIEIACKQFANSKEAMAILNFISDSAASSRSLCKPKESK